MIKTFAEVTFIKGLFFLGAFANAFLKLLFEERLFQYLWLLHSFIFYGHQFAFTKLYDIFLLIFYLFRRFFYSLSIFFLDYFQMNLLFF